MSAPRELLPTVPAVAMLPWLQLALLAAWLGAALLFSAAVAPAAFAVLPSRSLAGALVGRVLPVLFYTGMLLGALLLVAELAWRRGAWSVAACGGVMLAACAIAQLVVGARIARLRADIGGPLEALAADDPRRAAFGRLHAVSVGWLGAALLAALVAAVLVVARERAAARTTHGARGDTAAARLSPIEPVTSSR